MRSVLWIALLTVGACSQPAIYEVPEQPFVGEMPAKLEGWWQRDYSRGADVNAQLRAVFRQMPVQSADPRYGGASSAMSARQAESILALAKIAEEITRQDILTIKQDDNEIIVERKDDFDLFCSFYDGRAKRVDNPYGNETCGWDGDQLVSNIVLPDGLLIRHRFTISQDKGFLRVTTTVASSSSRVPFTLDRYYKKYVPPQSEFNCIETLSMKRVCSTGEIEP